MDWFNNLREWVRWIFCWPVSSILASFVPLICFLCVQSDVWLELPQELDFLRQLIVAFIPVIFQLTFLVIIHKTVPRWKNTFVALFITLRTIVGVMVLIFLAQQTSEPTPYWELKQPPFALEVISEIVLLVMSCLLLLMFLKQQRKQIASPA